MRLSSPRSGGPWLSELWRYRELVYFMAWRDVKIRYKQSLLGAAWAILQPTLTMLIFTVLFGRLARVPSDGVPYPLFSYSALVAWIYFATAVTYAGNSLVSNTDLLTKVYFPRMILPFAGVTSTMLDFVVASSLLVALLAYYHVVPGWSVLMWPVLSIVLLLFAFSVSLFLSALNVRYRDVKHTIPFVIQIWLFLTPVIYPTSIVPDRFRFLISLNPLTGLIEGFRASLIPSRPIQWNLIGVSVLATGILLIGGAAYFHRAERWFADVV